MGLLKALFVGIFVTFPFGVLVRISVTEQAYVYPVDFFVVLFDMYGLYLLLLKEKNISWLGNWKYFVIVAALSLIINAFYLELHEIIIASLYLFRLLLYILIIPILSTLYTKKDVKWMLYVMSSGIGMSVLIGYIQYFFYPDLRNLMYLGWDEHLYRLFSSYLDPNFASVVFVLLFWILVILQKVVKDKYLKYAIYCGIAATIGAILLTYSRTGYLTLIGSVVVYVLLTKKYKFIVIAVLIGLVGFIFLPRNLQSEGVDLFRTASITARFASYQKALVVAKNNPILGVGFNAYRYSQDNQSYNVGLARSHSGAGVPNSYLFVLATTGVVGLITFIIFCIQITKELISVPLPVRNSFVALFSAVLIGSLTENVFFYSFILIILCCCLGVVNLLKEKSGR